MYDIFYIMNVKSVKSGGTYMHDSSTNTVSTEKLVEQVKNVDTVENPNLSDKEREAMAVMQDMKHFAENQKVSLEKQKAFLLMEARCRKIYNNMMIGKLVASHDKHYLLENKPELFSLAENMAKEKVNPKKAEKVIKHYEKIKNLEDYEKSQASQVDMLLQKV